MNDESRIPLTLPIYPADNLVLFPETTEHVIVFKERDLILLTDVEKKYKFFGVVNKKEKGFEKIGTIGKIRGITSLRQMIKNAHQSNLRISSIDAEDLFLAIDGVSRFKILEIIKNEPYYLAKIQILHSYTSATHSKTIDYAETIKILYEKFLETVKLFGENDLLKPVIEKFLGVVKPFEKSDLLKPIIESNDPGFIADVIATSLPPWHLLLGDKQTILETLDVQKRLEKISYFLNREMVIAQSRKKVKKELGNSQKKIIINEQIRALEDELKKMGGAKENSEVKKYQEKAEKAQMPKSVKKEFDEELEKFSRADPSSLTSQYIRTWLDWMASLPWSKSTKERQDIKKAEEILKQDHYGLEKVKKRILEFLAVKQLKPEGKSPILCFIGPPGTGKTSVGKSIARAMNRKFIRISLGGAKDERQIRGFERTYVGALPGVIIQELKKAGSNNPVFMIDEIDKVGADWRGDPTSALLEVLDPEQNFAFRDHYLGVDFDLSKIMFICTGNLTDPIQSALRDRMEILEFPGYTREEKLMIAKRYLVNKQIEANGLNPKLIQFEDEALESIIRNYTEEAGVRNLERKIGTACRKTAAKIVKKEISQELINEEKISKILGPKKHMFTLKERISQPGIAIGLAWTAFGGKILFVETQMISGVKEPELEITGNIEKIMEESIVAALTFVEANLKMLGIEEKKSPIDKKIHIHVPEAAIPKDGPSAGITILVALVSLLTQKRVKNNLAMTGEITLRGKILPVGGIKEKILAAKEAGIKTVILPEKNKSDEEELPKSVKEAINRKEIQLKYVSEMEEAVKFALE